MFFFSSFCKSPLPWEQGILEEIILLNVMLKKKLTNLYCKREGQICFT